MFSSRKTYAYFLTLASLLALPALALTRAPAQLLPAAQVAAQPAAPTEVTYGAEIEFTHPKYDWNDLDILGPAAQTAKKLFRDEVAKTCVNLGCTVTGNGKGKYSEDFNVTFPDGWYFTISHDPGCIEITWKPITLREIKAKKEIINKAIFESAKNGGFAPDHEDVAHFNVGIKSAFGVKATDFIRFFVDYQNNTHLALGSLGEDLDNAPPLSVLGKEQRDELEKIVSQVEAGEIKTLSQAVDAIWKRVYTKSYNPAWGAEWGAEAGVRHYQAIGLKYASSEKLAKAGSPPGVPIEQRPNDAPMELRSVWAATNAEGFIKICELFEARTKLLKSQGGKIRYLKSARKSFTWEEAATRFYIYVTEAGLNYDEYKSLMPKDGEDAALADFLNPAAPLEARLASIQKYNDLNISSEYYRKIVENLIAEAKNANIHSLDNLLPKIQKARDAARPICKASLIL